MPQWPNWLRHQYGELEICGLNPGYDTNFSLKKKIIIYMIGGQSGTYLDSWRELIGNGEAFDRRCGLLQQWNRKD